ncbi:hypothetical protein ACIPLC_03405 [Kitasatospora sp. NPDC086801]|uniref:hypothetical protein n=1 Tax=Kitasatospora sp. NPDC086801 TaxID=3364066 RepID=UPI0037F16682
MAEDTDPVGDEIAAAIAQRGAGIYEDQHEPPSPYFYPNSVLQRRLTSELSGESLAGLPLRTRSKRAKELVCKALGFEIPRSFRKTQPRFPAANLDIYVQKANNLQIWNEEIDPDRRYALIRLDIEDKIVGVRVISGQELALLDTTGTLTSKYQAKLRLANAGSVLVSRNDTDNFASLLRPIDDLPAELRWNVSPVDPPLAGRVLKIDALFERLRRLEGYEFEDPGIDQERLRGIFLQQRVCQILELSGYADAGQFPDILCQGLEVKLQLSPTVDLGLVSPDSTNLALGLGTKIRHCDTRYAVVYAKRGAGSKILVERVVVATGRDFFSAFQRFEGNVQNRKLQIHLPSTFFVAV